MITLRKRVNNCAYTVIEVLFVIVLAAIFAAIVIPRADMGDFYERRMVYSIARQVAADIRLARRLAITHGSTNSSGYSFNFVGSAPYASWRIVDESDGSTVGADKPIDNAVVRVTGISSITFSTIGAASYSGSSITLRDQVNPRTVRYRIRLTSQTGRVELVRQS